MKKLIMFVCVGLAVGAVAEVEYGSLMGTSQSVTILAGETFTVMANNLNRFSQTADGDIYVYSPPSSETFVRLNPFVEYFPGTSATVVSKYATTDLFFTIAGPCRVQLANDNAYCSYKITRHEVTASPMNIVSLPDDNNGDVEILVETSTDLQSWTPVYSGSAGTSGTAAFIRTRLIQN